MAKASLKDRLKKGLEKRTEQSHQRRETSLFSGIFKDNMPFSVWNCAAGEHMIDVLPYFAGDYDPNSAPGDPTYCLEVWVHRNVGPNEDAFICLKKMYKKHCSICEERTRLRNLEEPPDDKVVNKLLPTRYCCYYVIVYDNEKEERKGPQILYVAHWFMERHLTAIAKRPQTSRGTPTGGFQAYADPTKDGKTVSFTKEGKGKGNVAFLAHRLIDRDYDIDDAILEKVANSPIDELIEIPEYQEVKDAFYGHIEEEPEVEEEPDDQATAEAEQEEEVPEEVVEEPTEEEQVEQTGVELKDPRCPGGGDFGLDIERLDHCGECKEWDKCSAESDRLAEERKKKREDRKLPRKDDKSRRGGTK